MSDRGHLRHPARGSHRQPTIARLHELFTLQRDGRLLRKVTMGARGRAGTFAGSADRHGYLQIEVCGYPTKVHRVVFAMAHGRWPSCEVDHLNGNKMDNRPENLREATRAINQQNLRTAKSHNKLGVLGVTHTRKGRFRASIVIDKKSKHLGHFDTIEEAHAAYVAAKRELHAGGTL